jgi:2-amino-4-hydroxy-6-hydroxymethyldihydropteridine diphosphokinase
VTIFAIAIATNLNESVNMHLAKTELSGLGECRFAPIYVIPCRDRVGADYWNSACLLESDLSSAEILQQLKHIEHLAGRQRPSHHRIALDVDLIAWGAHLSQMQFNPKKLPLPADVLIPMASLWPLAGFKLPAHQFAVVEELTEMAKVEALGS